MNKLRDFTKSEIRCMAEDLEAFIALLSQSTFVRNQAGIESRRFEQMKDRAEKLRKL